MQDITAVERIENGTTTPEVKMSTFGGKQIDLAQIDKFTQLAYNNFMEQVKQRSENKKSGKRAALVKKLVSRNRNRYSDAKFNLDLSYVTPRAIAMGLPG